MKGRALRTWIGRLNVGLALAAAVVWTHAARAPSGAPDAGEFDATLEVAPPASSARPWSEAEWVALVRRFHGPPPRPASARTPAGDDAAFVAGPLPLPMYRIAVLLRVPDGPDTVRLASKDRRRPSNVDLVEGEVVEGISIGWIRDVGEGVEVEIRRGDETFVLVHGDRAPPPSRIVAAAAEPPGRELGAGGGPAMSGAAADDPGLRLVPWRGPDGDVAGLRVTGMSPDSPFARTGLRVGDAILGLDDQRLTEPGEVVRRWRTGWRPSVALVRSTDGEGAGPTRLALR